MSAAFMFRAIPRPVVPLPPEYVTIPIPRSARGQDKALAVVQWNMVWEAAQFRRRMFAEDELLAVPHRLADRGDCNIVFVPRTRSRYHEYAPPRRASTVTNRMRRYKPPRIMIKT